MRIRYLLCVSLLASSATFAAAKGIGLPFCGEVSISAPATIRIVPDGSGPSLASLGATITVILRDSAYCLPVVGFSGERVGIYGATPSGEPGGLSLCATGWTGSGVSDATGTIQIAGAGFGGGSSAAGMRLSIDGAPVQGGPLIPLYVVSSDLNGDLAVDMLDLSQVPNGFVALYRNGSYDWQIDLDGSQTEDLRDVTIFAMDLGARCP